MRGLEVWFQFFAKLLNKLAETGQCLFGRSLEDALNLAGDRAGLLMPKHSQIAGKFVRDGLSLCTSLFAEVILSPQFRNALQKDQPFPRQGKMALPEVGHKCMNLRV